MNIRIIIVIIRKMYAYIVFKTGVASKATSATCTFGDENVKCFIRFEIHVRFK